MKIAYLINVYPRPNQTFIRREIAALQARGITIHRFALRPWTDDIDPADTREREQTRYVLGVGGVGLMIACLGALLTRPLAFLSTAKLMWKIGRRSERGLLRHIPYLAEACVLRRWLAECGADHLHCHYGTNTAAIAMLARQLGGPSYSFTAHGPEEFDKPEFLAMGEKIRRSAFVVAVSNYGRSQLYRWVTHDHWSKVHVVHCGVDNQFLSPASQPFPAAARLVSVGRLSEQKGQLLLVAAAAQLASSGVDFELVLIGEGEMRADIQQYIDEHNIGRHVKLAGWMNGEQIRYEMLASRALVMPSFAEGLPVVVMESLALERPVLSTYIAGIPELVTPGECGFLIPAGSVDALAGAMRQVLSTDPKQLHAMGIEGARRVRERHNATIEAAKLAGLFEAVIKRNAPTPVADGLDECNASATSVAA
jgi:glycosyltransferase involved in cell wall biosynthesis